MHEKKVKCWIFVYSLFHIRAQSPDPGPKGANQGGHGSDKS